MPDACSAGQAHGVNGAQGAVGDVVGVGVAGGEDVA
jgi:hypothetical protein